MENITIATAKDIPGIKALWGSVFTTDPSYLSLVFTTLFPLSEVYVYKENGIILSSLFLIPIKYTSPPTIDSPQNSNTPTVFNGKYLYGVCTSPGARGKKLSIKIVDFVSSLLKKEGEKFIITHPAEPSLFKFYQSQGFVYPVLESVFTLSSEFAHEYARYKELIIDSFSNNDLQNSAVTNAVEVLLKCTSLLSEHIAQTFSNRFEWDNEVLSYMINLGELEHYLGVNTPHFCTLNNHIALVKPLSNDFLTDNISDAFFAFPME